jgi:hypothetical protein
MSTPTPFPPLLVGPRDIGFLQDALASLIACWQDTLYWLRHVDERTPGAQPTVGYDTDRQQVTSMLDGSFGRGWAALDALGRLRLGYQAAVDMVGGIWNPGSIEVMSPEGLVLYAGAVLVYQAASSGGPGSASFGVQKYDVIVDPLHTNPDGAAVRYAVGDELANIQAFGTSIYRYAALEPRQPADGIYSIPLI